MPFAYELGVQRRSRGDLSGAEQRRRLCFVVGGRERDALRATAMTVISELPLAAARGRHLR